MNTIKLESGTIVKLYSSIKEMPVCLAQKQNMFLIQEGEIGHTMEDLHSKADRANMFIANDRKEEAVNEITNLKLCIFSIDKEIDYTSLAFGCYIHSINDKRITDHSQENIMAIISELSNAGLTNEMVSQQLEDIKKNGKRKQIYISPS